MDSGFRRNDGNFFAVSLEIGVEGGVCWLVESGPPAFAGVERRESAVPSWGDHRSSFDKLRMSGVGNV